MIVESSNRSSRVKDPVRGYTKPIAVVLACLCWTASHVRADDARTGLSLPVNRQVGQRLSNFTLNDAASGRPFSLYGFAGKKAAVLVFMGTECPLAKLYAPRLVELNHQYRERGVAFLVVYSNSHESDAEITEQARQFAIDFPVLRDPGNVVADLALVERTPEVLVLDGRRGSATGVRSTTSTGKAPARIQPITAISRMRSMPSWPGGRSLSRQLVSRVACSIGWIRRPGRAHPSLASAPPLRRWSPPTRKRARTTSRTWERSTMPRQPLESSRTGANRAIVPGRSPLSRWPVTMTRENMQQ